MFSTARLLLAAALCAAPVVASAANIRLEGPLVNETGESAYDVHLVFRRNTNVISVRNGNFDTSSRVNRVGSDTADWTMTAGANNGGQGFVKNGESARIDATVSALTGTVQIAQGYWTDASHENIGEISIETLLQLSFVIDGCDPTGGFICSGLLGDAGAPVNFGSVPLPAPAVLLFGALATLAGATRRSAKG